MMNQQVRDAPLKSRRYMDEWVQVAWHLVPVRESRSTSMYERNSKEHEYLRVLASTSVL